MVVHPAETDSGVHFLLPGTASAKRRIRAHWGAVVDTRSGIVLGNHHGETLRGAIPILAALHAAGIDNALVEVRGSRLMTDVSDFNFYMAMLNDAGTQAQCSARQLLQVVDTVEVRDGGGFVTLSPAADFRAYITMTTTHTNGSTDVARATLLSKFTEPYAFVSATSDEMHELMPVQAGVAGICRSLRDICALPDVVQATVVELLGHLALAGGPIAASIHGQDLNPRLYQVLLQTIMERRVVSPTTVLAHRARHDSAACPVAG